MRLFDVGKDEHVVSAVVSIDEEEAPENEAEEAIAEEMVEHASGGDMTEPDNPPRATTISPERAAKSDEAVDPHAA